MSSTAPISTAVASEELLLHSLERISVPSNTAGDLDGTYEFALAQVGQHQWLMPLDNRRIGFSAAGTYSPSTLKGRVLQCYLRAAALSGWPKWCTPRVAVSGIGIERLRSLIADITNEKQPSFAFSFSNPISLGKVNATILGRRGQVQAYLKIGLTSFACERLRNEARTLTRLAASDLRQEVPRLLYSGPWGSQGYLFLQSAAPRRRLPVQFGPLHERFLEKLSKLHPTGKLLSSVAEEVGRRIDGCAALMSRSARAAAAKLVDQVIRRFGTALVRCGLGHGDFAPWNLRRHNEELFAFDWESARLGVPQVWDRFHFKTQSECLLNGTQPITVASSDRPLYWLYLLDSMCSLMEEASTTGIEYRKKILAREVGIAWESPLQ